MSAFIATLRQAWGEWWSPRFTDAPAPLWAYSVVTVLFSTAMAVAFTGFAVMLGSNPVSATFWRMWVISQCVGFSIQTLFVLAARWPGPARINALTGVSRMLFFSAIPLAGVVIGYAIGFTLIGLDVPALFGSGRFWFGLLFVWAVLTVVWWRFYAVKLRLAEAESAREAERARAAELERRALDAQLRTLQAQIEPHFLFNTLANVVSLIDAAPAQARQMLERLIALLRASLAASRAPTTTLGQEFDLARAYLELLALRMGPRLAFEIALPEPLRAQSVPPLLVQPLLENAIQHALEPKVEGGRLLLRARAEATAVQVEVADDGLGFAEATASGVGLANLRERLAAHYGDRGRLTIEDARPGTRIRITLPLGAFA